jgi:hypothetical protein
MDTLAREIVFSSFDKTYLTEKNSINDKKMYKLNQNINTLLSELTFDKIENIFNLGDLHKNLEKILNILKIMEKIREKTEDIISVRFRQYQLIPIFEKIYEHLSKTINENTLEKTINDDLHTKITNNIHNIAKIYHKLNFDYFKLNKFRSDQKKYILMHRKTVYDLVIIYLICLTGKINDYYNKKLL